MSTNHERTGFRTLSDYFVLSFLRKLKDFILLPLTSENGPVWQQSLSSEQNLYVVE